jgi:hypothetical protein
MTNQNTSPLSAPSEPQERATDGTHHGNPCPSDECPCCTGEACDICDVSAVRNRCEHDVIERHAYPPETPATLEQQGPRQTWQPIETAPKDGTTILRPHRIWGAMDVRYLTEDQRHFTSVLADGIPWEWVNGDYTTAWTDSAFLPYWMPLPEPPNEPR